MHNPALTHIPDPGPVALPARWRLLFAALGGVGVVAFALGLTLDPARAWHNYLVGYYLFLGLGLVGLFFTALNHAVNATWVIAVRRVSEGFTAFLPVALLLFIGVIVGLRHIYPWAADPTLSATRLKPAGSVRCTFRCATSPAWRRGFSLPA